MDEGYSEETHAGSNDATELEPEPFHNPMLRYNYRPSKEEAISNLPVNVRGMSDLEKADLIHNILFTLPTSSISTLSKQLIPFLHIDPATQFPSELVIQTLTYLSVSQILGTSTLSKSWNFQAMQPGLWRRKFVTSGWNWNRAAVRRFETEVMGLGRTPGAHATFGNYSMSHKRPSSKRRRVNTRQGARERKDSTFSEGLDQSNTEMADDSAWPTRGGLESQPQSHSFGSSSSADAFPSMELDVPESPLGTRFSNHTVPHPTSEAPRITTALVAPAEYGRNRMNWYHLYKQRRRLENNWRTGEYKNFQLPHACYPEEAHTECVYAIQYTGDLLVSGSRDHSIRVWDIPSQRLIKGPLIAHKGSVLCLQFDASPDQDTLISGSSDNSVVVWKLSTGEVVQTILNAHDDSVLNLRFDREILVTCSKDKTIRVWNRMFLYQSDTKNRFMPLVGISATPDPISVPRLGEPRCRLEMMDPAMRSELSPPEAARALHPVLEPYSLIRILDGHIAAVNAVQIYQNQIVSASGDRNMKIWDWKTGRTIRVILGHRNGIACVQYDGRRIITGSSDNSIRIFDAASGAPVSDLGGHSALVRTVQCSFGDTTGSSLDDLEEAVESDVKHWEAQFDNEHLTRKGRLRSTDYLRNIPSAIGARLPTGGGGSSNARIVSGSYDERIAIWRRDKEGHWSMATVLRADEAIERATLTQLQDAYRQGFGILKGFRVTHDPPRPPTRPAAAIANTSSGTAPLLSSSAPAQRVDLPRYKLEPVSGGLDHVPQSIDSALRTDGSLPVRDLPPALAQHIQNMNPRPDSQQGSIRWQYVNPMPSQLPAAQRMFPSSYDPWQPPVGEPTQSQQGRDGLVGEGWAGQIPNTLPPGPGGGTTRVFKLQFDARMIVACTQDSRIVGWDFARGDKDILEACPFFSE